MSELAEVPKYHELMPFVLESLRTQGGTMSCASMFQEARRRGFPAGPRLEKNRQRLLENRLGWARTYLRKVGVVELVDRGRWALTERGKQVDLSDPKCIERLWEEAKQKVKHQGKRESPARKSTGDHLVVLRKIAAFVSDEQEGYLNESSAYQAIKRVLEKYAIQPA